MGTQAKISLMNSFIQILSKKPLDKISVKDIFSGGFGRNSFYYYYEDIYELLEDLLQTETRNISKKYPSSTWQDTFIESLEFVIENPKAFNHLYNSIERARIEKFLFHAANTTMTCFVKRAKEDNNFNISDEDLAFITTSCSLTLCSLVLNWFEKGMEGSLEDTIYKFGDVFEGSIILALENCVPDEPEPKKSFWFW